MRTAGACLVALCGFVAAEASGDAIRLSVTASGVMDTNGARIELQLRNGGDAAAVNVTPIAAFRGTEILGTFHPQLTPGDTLTDRLVLPVNPAAPPVGTWPFYVRVTYSDTGGHPFEALHVGRVAFDPEPSDSPVSVQLSNARLATTGTSVARVDGPAGARITVTFAAPLGLTVVPDNAVLTLDGTRRALPAILSNAGATAGSQLPLFAVAEYEHAGRHGTAVAMSLVDVAAEGEARAVWPALVMLLAALALGLYVLVPGYWRGRRG